MSDRNEERLSWLPAIYRELAERAGLEAALGLARAKGGQRVYLPKDPRVAPWMAEAMGDAGARALADMYGGEAIELPVDPVAGMSQKARIRRINELLRAGESANSIAQKTAITRRHVFRRAAILRDAEAAPDLFTPIKPR